MRIGILTSVETRHRYFVHAVRARFNVAAVAYEQTGYSPADVDAHDPTAVFTIAAFTFDLYPFVRALRSFNSCEKGSADYQFGVE